MPNRFDIEASLRGVNACRLDIYATAHQKAKDSLTPKQLGEYESYMDRVNCLLRNANTPPEEDAAVQQANNEFPQGTKAAHLIDEYAEQEERRIMGT